MVRYEDKTQVDFVVIGGGGAGAIVANELSAAGFQVVILEQGPYLHEGDFEHDELKFKNLYASPAIGHEVLTSDHALQPNTFRKSEKREGGYYSLPRIWEVRRRRHGPLHRQLLALS